MDAEEILINISADLVSLEKYDPFMTCLFVKPAGEWTAVEPLCSSWAEINQQLQTLENIIEGDLYVTWLDFPQAQHGSRYCQIIFFFEPLPWHNIALYNKQAFLSLKLFDAQKQVTV